MHVIASLSVVAGLIVATALPQFHWQTTSSPATPAAARFVLDPGLTRTLPPVYFCGETVPLHEEAVARRLVSALAQHTAKGRVVHQIRQRAAVFFPIIEPILTKYNIPQDFKYLPLVESALQSFAVSSKGAVGYWQFMPATARELGLAIQPGRDERKNLLKSTDAACRYLRYLYNRLGSWTLAAAAYNHGIGALLGNIRRQQQRDYYYLRLNPETGKYLYRILAFKELLSNYRSYEHLIPSQLMAYLSEPLPTDPATNLDEVLLSENTLDAVTELAFDTVATPDTTSLTSHQPVDIPLPNAADVFRGGIRARLVESSGVKRGQVWVFHLTRSGLADGREVEEGDILYAVVEDIDPKTNKLYLRADRVYSNSEKHLYSLALTAIDASTGRNGIKIPDVDQVKSGWILTWKSL